jgi:outer membrane lipoprotein carrier protein
MKGVHVYGLVVLSFMCMFSSSAMAAADVRPEVIPVATFLPMPAELSGMLHALKNAPGFSASFSQSLIFSDGSEQHYQGELDVLPPGRFRWRYAKPYEQLFVSDGVNIWHYEPDLMQASVLKQMREVDPAVMQLLSGRLGLADVHLLEAHPAQHRYYVRLGADTQVWLGLRDGRLDYIEGRDALGNANRISLTNMRLQAPNVKIFYFVPPKGVDVVPLD